MDLNLYSAKPFELGMSLTSGKINIALFKPYKKYSFVYGSLLTRALAQSPDTFQDIYIFLNIVLFRHKRNVLI